MNNGRETIQKLAQFGQRQQEELLSRQEQIRQTHEHLIQNSHSILEAQVLNISHFENITSFTCLLLFIDFFHIHRKSLEQSRLIFLLLWTSCTFCIMLFYLSLASSRPSSSIVALCSSSTCSPVQSKRSASGASSTSV